ncbi:hypothetical protein BDW67DRAFT_186177 [Aspergillus spinulosporus]
MVNHKEDQGREAINKIKEEARLHANIEWVPCDVGNLTEIREVASRFAEKEERLDLVRRALCPSYEIRVSGGINVHQYGEIYDRIDRHFQVDWLGQFYRTNLLWPLLRKTSKLPDTPAPRVVFESSEQHRAALSGLRFRAFRVINNPDLGPMERHGRTKLAIILGVKYGL